MATQSILALLTIACLKWTSNAQSTTAIAPTSTIPTGPTRTTSRPYSFIVPKATMTGSSDPEFYGCWNKHLESMSAYFSSSIAKITITTTVPSHTAFLYLGPRTPIPPTVRCDKTYLFQSALTAVAVTFNWPSVSTISPRYIYSTCPVSDEECIFAHNQFKTISSLSAAEASASIAAANGGQLPVSVVVTGSAPCTTMRLPTCPGGTDRPCSLNVPKATVLYWPTTWTGEFCGARTHVEATPTVPGQPNTAVFRGTTITSPTVLLVARSISKLIRSKTSTLYSICGPKTDMTLLLQPTDLSTVRHLISSASMTVRPPNKRGGGSSTMTAYTTSQIPYPIDFADLNYGDVPPVAYFGRDSCSSAGDDKCVKSKTIMATDYVPLLAVPPGIATAKEEWRHCSVETVNRFGLVFVPITSATVTLPGTTRYHATASVGPEVRSIEPVAALRAVMSEITPTPVVEPVQD